MKIVVASLIIFIIYLWLLNRAAGNVIKNLSNQLTAKK
jgi:preprotein translocase subunit SecE